MIENTHFENMVFDCLDKRVHFAPSPALTYSGQTFNFRKLKIQPAVRFLTANNNSEAVL